MAFNNKGWSNTTEVSLGPASAIIFATVTKTVSLTGLGQPKVSVTVTIYLTLDVGLVQIGLAISRLFKNAEGVHE